MATELLMVFLKNHCSEIYLRDILCIAPKTNHETNHKESAVREME